MGVYFWCFFQDLLFLKNWNDYKHWCLKYLDLNSGFNLVFAFQDDSSPASPAKSFLFLDFFLLFDVECMSANENANRIDLGQY